MNSLYQRLPGRGHRGHFLAVAITTSSTLWLGADHLLSVDLRDYQEEYRRFYYADIQAIIVRKTSVALVQNIVLGLLLLVTAVIGALTGTIGWIVGGILAFLILVILGVNLLRGPTCICHLVTAIHTHQLASLNRIKTARRALDRLRPRIVQAQGTLTREEFLARVEG